MVGHQVFVVYPYCLAHDFVLAFSDSYATKRKIEISFHYEIIKSKKLHKEILL